MPINASYEYLNAEKKYLQAQTLDEKISAVEEMIKTAPRHKSSENLLVELRSRLKKLREKKEKSKKVGKTTQKSIRKEGYQVVLLGFPNAGKSSLLARLTNAKPIISSIPFATKKAEIGTFEYEGIKAQIVDLPSIGSEFLDIGIVNTADCVLLVLEKLNDLEKITPQLARASGKRFMVINKADLLFEQELRRLQETIKSKRLPATLVSCVTGFGIQDLKEYIVQTMNVIRVYTKEPGKSPSPLPIVLPAGSTVKDVAESIRKGFSFAVKEARLTGPSSKFPNQRIGLSHVLKDRDIVEFHTF